MLPSLVHSLGLKAEDHDHALDKNLDEEYVLV